MPKDDHVDLEGEIIDAMGGGKYQVREAQGGAILMAQLSGRMKRNRIRVLPGDRVKVSVSPYDMTHGIITFRSKK